MGGKQTNYRHWFTSRLPYGWLSLPVRFQVIQGIASIAMYFSYRCNPISASMKASNEAGILRSNCAIQRLGLQDLTWSAVTPRPSFSTVTGHRFMFYILPVCAARRMQKYLLACFFHIIALRCFRVKSFQTCHSVLSFNTWLINVAHTLIIHVKDFFLLGVYNCQEPRRPHSPLCLMVERSRWEKHYYTVLRF